MHAGQRSEDIQRSFEGQLLILLSRHSRPMIDLTRQAVNVRHYGPPMLQSCTSGKAFFSASDSR
jgi:hypothetical protein